MKSYRKELWFNVPARRALVNITPMVREALHESGIQEGLCLDNALNITPHILINDAAGAEAAGPRTGAQPCRPSFAGAHLKQQGPRRAAVVAVTNGRLDFGAWKQVFYGESDGRRRKRVLVKSRRHAVLARCSFGIIGE